MKKLLIVLSLAFAVVATQSIIAQDKPAEKKDQKTHQATAKGGEKCAACDAKTKKDACKEKGSCACCAKKEGKKSEMKQDEKKQDEKKQDEKK